MGSYLHLPRVGRLKWIPVCRRESQHTSLSTAVIGLRDGIELLLAGRVPQHKTHRLTIQPAAHKRERLRSEELQWEGNGKHTWGRWCFGCWHPQGLHQRCCSYCGVLGVDTLRAWTRDVRIVVLWNVTPLGPAREMVFILWCSECWHPQGLHERCSYCGVMDCDTLRACTRDVVHIVVFWVLTPSGPTREMFVLWCYGLWHP